MGSFQPGRGRLEKVYASKVNEALQFAWLGLVLYFVCQLVCLFVCLFVCSFA